MWYFNLPNICRENKFVVFDASGLCAPILPNPEPGKRERKIELFIDVLKVADYWSVPHAVHDEILVRSHHDVELKPLVELLAKHCSAPNIPRRARKLSVETGNAFGMDDFDRVAIMYAVGFVDGSSALLTGKKNNVEALHTLQSVVGTDHALPYVFRNGNYVPVYSPAKVPGT
jgi:hypothetical protein